MVVLSLWYNPKNNSLYFKEYVSVHSLNRVGYTNQYGHIVMYNMTLIENRAFFLDSPIDYYNLQKPKPTLKNRAINRLVDLLVRLK